jgi:hypothetical protein
LPFNPIRKNPVLLQLEYLLFHKNKNKEIKGDTMSKFNKLYIIFAILAFCLFGCGNPDMTPSNSEDQIVEGGINKVAVLATTSYDQTWAESKAPQMNVFSGGFELPKWDIDKGFVYGRGWKSDSKNSKNEVITHDIITYKGSYTPSEGGMYGIYGWLTTSDGGLVEYYICETVGSKEGPYNNNDGQNDFPSFKGTLDDDGDTYKIYVHDRIGKPSIRSGTSDNFTQWISIRNSNRTSGVIHIQKHIDKWLALTGKKMGDKYASKSGNGGYRAFVVEGWTAVRDYKTEDKQVKTNTGYAKVTLYEGEDPVATNPPGPTMPTKYAFKSAYSGKYLQVHSDRTLWCDGDSINNNTKFLIDDLGNGNIALRPLSYNNYYVCAESGGTARLFARTPASQGVGSWETFTLSQNGDYAWLWFTDTVNYSNVSGYISYDTLTVKSNIKTLGTWFQLITIPAY